MPTNNFASFAEFFKAPVDMNKVFDSQRRNIEAASEAVQTVVEGVQAVSRRQAEVLREGVEQALASSRQLLSSGTPEAGLAKQAELARNLFESAVINFREVSELLTKTSFEAFDVLNSRASEAISETQAAGSKRKNG